MSKKSVIVFVSLAVIGIIISGIKAINSKVDKEISSPSLENQHVEISTQKNNQSISVVPTMNDKILGDSAWCATFQLVWNDMINELVKQDVVFEPQEMMAVNLNKQEFKENMISDEYYYKKFGLKTLKLKEEIEKGIKEKFNENSDVLDDINWLENDADISSKGEYIFYTMLKREFNFINKFDDLGVYNFKNTENIKYFGVNENTEDIVTKQVDVLFYNSIDDFAIKLNTKTGDEVILYKTKLGNNFNEIYNEMNKQESLYKGSKYLEKGDILRIPYIKFDVKKEYNELCNKTFLTKVGEEMLIDKAIQTIKLELNSEGGKIKSEAVIDAKNTSIIVNEKIYSLDDTFVMFLKEKNKDIPYFALKVNDISKYQ